MENLSDRAYMTLFILFTVIVIVLTMGMVHFSNLHSIEVRKAERRCEVLGGYHKHRLNSFACYDKQTDKILNIKD